MRSSNWLSVLKSDALWEWLIWLVILGLTMGFVWRFVILPVRIEGHFDRALAKYEAGDFAGAVAALEAYGQKSRNAQVSLLLAKSYQQLRQLESAEFYFERASRLNPSVEEAKLGLARVRLALDKGATALPLLEELAQKRPQDKQIRMQMAEAYVKSGQNRRAAEVYLQMLARDPEDQHARREFLGLYGYPEYRSDLPLTFTPAPRPAQAQISFRTQGNYFQVRVGDQWRDLYVAGVNIGPARPNEFPSTASREVATYLEWFEQIAALNANTVRVYTVLPPAFYQALKAYNERVRSPLWLIQEVWIRDDVEELYDPATEKGFRQDLTSMIDLLHGQGDLPFRRGYNYGIYTADVSRYVLALAVGREVEPRVVVLTNRKNASQTSYRGRYVRIEQGTPTEVWFARMCDLAVRYEVEKYNAQRPLTAVTWPPLDPMTHPTEATYEEEQNIRRKLGEIFDEKAPLIPNDNDVVSFDITKFKAEQEFASGFFAFYNVYQHWPDFLLHEPSYALARDAQGPNRYLGYLRELKNAHPNFPLLIGEYGASTSLAPAHLHPQGWHNGGLTEKQQAELLVRFTRNIRETGCAGSVVFEWLDEWFKHVHDFNTADLELPWERNPLWRNVLDPEKHFGLVGFDPAVPVPLLRGEQNDWLRSEQLYAWEGVDAANRRAPGDLWTVYATTDFAYFYLLLDVEPGELDWGRRSYWIALNTLPAQSGSRTLPQLDVNLDSGANFLIQLTGPSSSRILIADNYNPNIRVPIKGRPGVFRMWRKLGMKVELEDAVPFQEILTEVNQPRYARDGRAFPAQNFNRSPLPYGVADRRHADFSSHALWHADPQKGMVELRIPWGLLWMTDPSSLQAFAGTDEKLYTSAAGAWLPKSRATPGISVAVFALWSANPGGVGPGRISSSLPVFREGRPVSPRIATWKKWDQVQFLPFFKRSYFDLQKLFAEVARSSAVSPLERATRRRMAR